MDLLLGDQPDLVDQARQHPHGVGAAAEAEQIDRVALLVIVDDEFVGVEHIVVEPVAGGEPEDRGRVLHQLLPRIGPRQRADAGIVEHHLARRGLLGLAQGPVQLEHIGNVLADLVAGAVAADDDVFHGCGPASCGREISYRWGRWLLRFGCASACSRRRLKALVRGRRFRHIVNVRHQ